MAPAITSLKGEQGAGKNGRQLLPHLTALADSMASAALVLALALGERQRLAHRELRMTIGRQSGQELARLLGCCSHHVAPALKAARMDIGNPREFYFGLPVVTRLWVTAGVITTVGAALGMVPVQMLNLNWAAVLYRVQVSAA